MKLADYLSSTGQSVESFARQLGVSETTVHRYLKGTRVPRWSIMARISEVTKGKVTADDFMFTAVGGRGLHSGPRPAA